jgi:hypothetical protein
MGKSCIKLLFHEPLRTFLGIATIKNPYLWIGTRLKKISPASFEQIVVELLVKMGYGGSRLDAGKAIGRSGDGGIDEIIKEDKLVLDVVYIQAKRWDNNLSPLGEEACWIMREKGFKQSRVLGQKRWVETIPTWPLATGFNR